MSQDTEKVQKFNEGKSVAVRNLAGMGLRFLLGESKNEINFTSHKEVAEFLKRNIDQLKPENFVKALNFYAADKDSGPQFEQALHDASVGQDQQKNILDWAAGVNLPQAESQKQDKVLTPTKAQAKKKEPAKTAPQQRGSRAASVVKAKKTEKFEPTLEDIIEEPTSTKKQKTKSKNAPKKDKENTPPKNFEMLKEPQKGAVKDALKGLRKSVEQSNAKAKSRKITTNPKKLSASQRKST